MRPWLALVMFASSCLYAAVAVAQQTTGATGSVDPAPEAAPEAPSEAAPAAPSAAPQPAAEAEAAPTPAEAAATVDPEAAVAEPAVDAAETSSEESTEEEEEDDEDEAEAIAYKSFQAPALPAMALINADVSNVDRPGSVRDLGLAVANVVTPKGTVRAGVSIEVTPRLFGATRDLSAYQYRNMWFRRFLSRIGLSVATTSESPTDTAPATTRLAAGLRLVFWDEADPLLDPGSIKAQQQAEKDCSKAPPLEQADCYAKKGETELGQTDELSWNLGGLSIAGAASWAFVEGETDDSEFDSGAAWVNLAIPIGSYSQLLLSGRVRSQDGDNGDLGGFARMRMGTEATRGYVEGGFLSADADGESSERYRLLVGAELKLAKSVWLTASLGGDFGEDVEEANDVGELFVLSNLQWALDDEPSWKAGN